MKNARRKLEILMPAAIPCKTRTNCRGETCRNLGKHKTKYDCIVDADESVRIGLEGVVHKHLEDHINAKGINSPSRYNLVHKSYSDASSIEKPDAKAAVEKELGNWESTGMAFDKSQKQEKR